MQVKLFLVKRLRAGFFEFQQLISFLSEKLVIRETNASLRSATEN